MLRFLGILLQSYEEFLMVVKSGALLVFSLWSNEVLDADLLHVLPDKRVHCRVQFISNISVSH